MTMLQSPEPARHARRSRWAGLGLVAVSLALLSQAVFHWWPRTVDDAFITFRYAQNLVDGFGPVYNPGEQVEGYSSPSWMLASAAAIAAGVDPVAAAKWAGLLAAAALVLAIYLALRASGVRGWGAGLATLVAGASFVVQLWSVSGMETTVYALLFFIGLMFAACGGKSVRGASWSSALLAVAALTRPEGLLFWALGFGAIAVGSGRVFRRMLAYAVPGLAIALHFAWRMLYYGVPLPNTYYAKTGGGLRMWRQGFDAMGGFVSDPAHALWLTAAVVGLLAGLARRDTRRAAGIVGLSVLVYLLYIASVGDDGLFIHRFYVPIIAPLAYLIGLLFYDDRSRPTDPVTDRSWWLAAVGVFAVVVGAALSVQKFYAQILPNLERSLTPYLEGNIKLGRHLAAARDPDTLIAVPSAGAIPFYSRLRTIDMYGLNDAHIGRGSFPVGTPGHMMKWDNSYVLSRRPDLIVLNRGYVRAGESPDASASPMDLDLIQRLRLHGDYALGEIDFDDGSRFYVFERLPDATP